MGSFLRDLFRELRRQGFRVEGTESETWSVYAPDGRWVADLIGTQFESQTWMNILPDLRYYGFQWPPLE